MISWCGLWLPSQFIGRMWSIPSSVLLCVFSDYAVVGFSVLTLDGCVTRLLWSGVAIPGLRTSESCSLIPFCLSCMSIFLQSWVHYRSGARMLPPYPKLFAMRFLLFSFQMGLLLLLFTHLNFYYWPWLFLYLMVAALVIDLISRSRLWGGLLWACSRLLCNTRQIGLGLDTLEIYSRSFYF